MRLSIPVNYNRFIVGEDQIASMDSTFLEFQFNLNEMVQIYVDHQILFCVAEIVDSQLGISECNEDSY